MILGNRVPIRVVMTVTRKKYTEVQVYIFIKGLALIGHNRPADCLICLLSGFTARQPNWVMSSAVSLPNHTFTGQASSSKRLTTIVHILSLETDNCPSWISGRERMTVENISWSLSTKDVADLGGGWTRDFLVSSRTAHPTEPPRPATRLFEFMLVLHIYIHLVLFQTKFKIVNMFGMLCFKY